MAVPTKSCATCGRTITWRRAWALSWDQVRYCSDGCRRHRPDAADVALERAVLELLDERAASASTCPSEAARRVAPQDWRPLMERARAAGRRLQARGEVEWTQGGHVVDPSTAKGPVRLRRVRRG